jgi:hypothetical protein
MPQALQRKHAALQNMKYLIKFWFILIRIQIQTPILILIQSVFAKPDPQNCPKSN